MQKESESPDRKAFVAERQTALAVAAVSFLLYFWRRAPFAGQWDSFDYLKETVAHQLSPLGFGRPVFVGCNIAIWEALRAIFRLEPQQVEPVALGAVILTGAAAVYLFSRLARQVLPADAARMALLALALSPTYAFYSGTVMTEAPMLFALIGAASILWGAERAPHFAADVAAGVLFGIAFGIREQALLLFPAFLWISWVRRPGGRVRLQSLLVFAGTAFLSVITPVAILYLANPPAFAARMKAWLAAIPTGPSHFWMNVQASLLWTVAACPAAWLAVAGACVWRLSQIGKPRLTMPAVGLSKPAGVAGVLLCLALPVAALWRDADVQIHPRYALIVLPAASIVAAALYRRWAPSKSAVVVWAVLQVSAFGLTQVGMQPFRNIQFEKRDYARLVRERVDGPALLIAGQNSAAFDYYRSIGLRPRWRIAWSGWDWSPEKLDAMMRDSWRRGEPVYLCDGPAAWLNLEGERLDVEFLLRHYTRQPVAPGLIRILPVEGSRRVIAATDSVRARRALRNL